MIDKQKQIEQLMEEAVKLCHFIDTNFYSDDIPKPIWKNLSVIYNLYEEITVKSHEDLIEIRPIGYPLIFLDIDGVLNDHKQLGTGYCTILYDQVKLFNQILEAVPEVRIVISSAWRYLVLRGDMSIKGFEYLLLIHGVNCKDKVIGTTCSDADICEEPSHYDIEAWKTIGIKMRKGQIDTYVRCHNPSSFVVLDDLDIGVDNLVKTNSDVGLTEDDVKLAIKILKGQIDA